MGQNRGQIDSGGNNVQKQGPGDMVMDQKKRYPVTTAGDATLPAEAVLAGIVERTGPGAGFNDTMPSAMALLAACPQLGNGDSFEFIYRNGVAQAMTAVAGVGITLVNANVAASAIRRYLVTVIAAGAQTVASAGTTNTSTTVTLNKLSDAKLIQPGMLVTGTGIAGGTTVAAVNTTTGTVTLSAAATATNAVVGLTFTPSIEVRGLYSATA